MPKAKPDLTKPLFKVGDLVRSHNDPRLAEVRSARPGAWTGKMLNSVKYPKDKGWGFYYNDELTLVKRP